MVSLSVVNLDQNSILTDLLNGTYTSLKNVVPLHHEMHPPKKIEQYLLLHFGVLIGITGDIQAKMIISGETSIFSTLSQALYGMTLEGEMLTSFSGELGNMIAGSLSTIIIENGLKTDITAPTIVQENTKLSGFRNAINLPITIASVGKMDIFLLFD